MAEITLSENIKYDSEKTFEEQTDDCKNFLNIELGKLKPTEETEPAGVFSRITKQTYKLGNFTITKTFVYLNSSNSNENGIVKEVIYGIVE